MNTFIIISENKSDIDDFVDSLIVKNRISKINITEILPEPSIGIAEIRKVKKSLNLKPYGGGKRLIILREMDKATTEAQNALLKVLEEPPVNNIIVLSCLNSNNILPTVLSRCQKVSLVQTVKQNIKSISDIENIFIKLIYSSPGDRIIISQDYSNTKEQSLEFTDNLLSLLSTFITSNKYISRISIKEIADIIRKINKARILIEKNVNYKLTLDILLLGFPTKSAHKTLDK